MKLSSLVLVGLFGCHQSSMTTGDGGLDSSDPDGDPDGDPDATTVDAPPDGPPITGDCTTHGIPQVVSTATSAPVRFPHVATIGTKSMVVWSHGSNQHAHETWALLDAGVVTAHGDIAIGNDTSVYALGDTFVVTGDNGQLWTFDGTAFVLAPGYAYNVFFLASGSTLAGFSFMSSPSLTVKLFDGTTFGSETVLAANHHLGAVVADDAGGYAVVSVDTAAMPNLRFLTYSGVAWSAESPIATLAANPTDLRLVRTPTRYALSYSIANVGYVWELANGTWTNTKTISGTTSSRFTLAANGETLAVAGNGGYVAVGSGATWTEKQLNANPSDTSFLPPTLEAFGAGFVDVYGFTTYSYGSPMQAAVYDGTAWGSPKLLVADSAPGRPNVAVSAAGVTIAFNAHDQPTGKTSPRAIRYTGGAWGSAVPIAAIAQDLYAPAPLATYDGPDGRVIFGTPGVVETATLGATISTPVALPQSDVSGTVYGSRLAHAANGHALVTWVQDDADDQSIFAAEFDGSSWGAPAKLATDAEYNFPQAPSVAAVGGTFVLAWNQAGGHRKIAKWTGAGITTPQDLGTFSTWFYRERVFLASDGTHFVAAWSDNPQPHHAIGSMITSTDGTTWTTPAAFEDEGYELADLIASPFGVLSYSVALGGTDSIRLWQNGTWSASRLLAGTCHAAIGSATAMAMCENGTLTGSVYANGAWTQTTVAGESNPSGMTIATDGTDYRLDFGAPIRSTVWHAGTWSPTAIAPTGVEEARFGAAACGGWTLIYGDQQHPFLATSAVGAAAYPSGTPLAFSYYQLAAVSAGPVQLDAIWVAPANAAAGLTNSLWVNLGL